MIDSKQKYLLFCMEVYKKERGLSGRQVYELFQKYGFDDYIMELYELLHIQGTHRLMEELDRYQAVQDRKIAKRGTL